MHNYLTPLAGKLFLTLGLLAGTDALLAQDNGQANGQAPAPSAQDQDSSLDLSHYMGPGLISPGAGTIGERAGAPTGFRVYGTLSGVYDTYQQPLLLDANGKLVSNGGVLGVEAGIGVVGTHIGRRSKMGIDYHGTIRHYDSGTLNGSDQGILLGYTVQLSRHFILDLRETGGSYVYGGSGPGALLTSDPSSGLTVTSQVLDQRVNYVRSAADVTYRATSRTFYTFGAHGYFQEPKGAGLSKNYGYDANARTTHRLNKNVNIGATYRFSQMYFPISNGTSQTHALEASFSTVFDRHWLFSLEAGASLVNIQNDATIKLDPALAAIFGPTLTFHSVGQSAYPSGLASLSRTFRTSSVGITYSRGITSGNGLYTTSRQQNLDGRFSYSGIRRWTLGVTGRYGSLIAIGQSLGNYGGFSGGGFGTYSLGHGVHFTSDYTYSHQTIANDTYKRNGSRVLFGIQFSKGNQAVGAF